MNTTAAAAPGRAMNLNDLLYLVLRHRWKILVCTFLGLVGAGTAYFVRQPPYRSDALLLIRYVVENSIARFPGSDAKPMSPDIRGETILQTESAILSSVDLIYQVVDAVTPDKILSDVKDPKKRSRDAAAVAIQRNLLIDPVAGSSVIHLSYRNTDPAVVQPVLAALIEAYFKKHQEVHDGVGTMGEFFTQQADQFHSRVTNIDDQLRKARLNLGISSVEEAKRVLNEHQASLQQEIYAARAELAQRSATLDAITKSSGNATKSGPAPTTPPADEASKQTQQTGSTTSTAITTGPTVPAITQAAAPAPVPSEKADEYRRLLAQLEAFHQSYQQLRTQFTEENEWVKNAKSQIAEAEKAKNELESTYPSLVPIAAGVAATHSTSGIPVATGPATTINVREESARLAGLQAKLKLLEAELESVQTRLAAVEQAGGPISDLERQKEIEEANYKYYLEHLESTRIDQTLGANRPTNIAEIQKPTPPEADIAKVRKLIAGIGASGLILGLIWAGLIEFYFDRTIRSPEDVERNLRLPLFLSIPAFGTKGAHRQIFFETLRDRLIGFLESKGLTHKPKLIAVTSVGRNAGVTTTATGLAQCLSETGEGNVLLVDMTQSQGASQHFCKGNVVCDIDQLLTTRNEAQVQDRLYVVGTESKNDKLSRALPARFNRLVPQLKTSDFDYIIFDMPAVNQISITPRLAGFMDFVLFVAESEKTDRDIAKQAAGLLSDSRTNVGVVLNKTRQKVLSRAHHEFIGGNV